LRNSDENKNENHGTTPEKHQPNPKPPSNKMALLLCRSLASSFSSVRFQRGSALPCISRFFSVQAIPEDLLTWEERAYFSSARHTAHADQQYLVGEYKVSIQEITNLVLDPHLYFCSCGEIFLLLIAGKSSG
jgi:3-hydroxymyristoyl/3-hydroxydecanoyl-(acyl carrier protein) dehydratase